MDAQVELRGVIYNQRVAAWEPFIEPLEDPTHGIYRNWKLVAKVSHMLHCYTQHEKTWFMKHIISGS